MKKKCKKCLTDKNETDFYPYIKYICKECIRLKERTYHNKNKEKRQQGKRINGLKKKYNLSIEQLNQMILDQNNKCGICFNEMTKPCIDHNHHSGKVRKLLCFHCNVLLGHCKENIEILQSAIYYLSKEKDLSGPFQGVLISGELNHNRVMSQTLLFLFTTAHLIDRVYGSS